MLEMAHSIKGQCNSAPSHTLRGIVAYRRTSLEEASDHFCSHAFGSDARAFMQPRGTMIRIGVDTGGTFTDLVCLDEEGLRVHKVRSTPEDPAHAILAGIGQMTAGKAGRERIAEVVHGSTVATNAVLERKGARVALVATHG